MKSNGADTTLPSVLPRNVRHESWLRPGLEVHSHFQSGGAVLFGTQLSAPQANQFHHRRKGYLRSPTHYKDGVAHRVAVLRTGMRRPLDLARRVAFGMVMAYLSKTFIFMDHQNPSGSRTDKWRELC